MAEPRGRAMLTFQAIVRGTALYKTRFPFTRSTQRAVRRFSARVRAHAVATRGRRTTEPGLAIGVDVAPGTDEPSGIIIGRITVIVVIAPRHTVER